MDILFLSQIVPYPPHGGVLQRGYNIVREIARHNSVHLLAFVHPDTLTTPRMVEDSLTHLQTLCTTVKYFPLWPKRSKWHKIGAFAAGLFYPGPFSVLAHRSGAYAAEIDEIVNRRNIDVIHYDTIGLAPYRYLHPDIPSVLTHHNIESQLMARRAMVEANPLARFYVARQARRLRNYEAAESPKFDCNVMMSQVDEAILKAMAPEVRTRIVPNGVDTDYFAPQLGGTEPAMIYTGGMNMFANKDAVMYFIQSIWPRIRAAVPEACFYAIGQDPPAEILQAAARDDHIQVTGYVDDVRPYVARAAVYVVPLRVGGGTRLKVVDAMAQGKAIVSTTLGCEGIAVTADDNIVIADTPEVFADRTIALLNDRARRVALGTAARRLVEERYAWTGIGNLLQEVYEDIAGRARAEFGMADRAEADFDG